MARKCKNWLLTLRDYSEETETPQHFWTWSGIFVISSALQRKVWTPFGQKKLYPNIYLMTIAPPGFARKSPPIRFAKQILGDLQLPIFVDSPSKRALTKHLDELSRRCHFDFTSEGGRTLRMPQAPLALVSPELSTFLALDIKGIIEALTDLYDCPDTWDYKTSEKGEDKLVAPYLTAYFASTPAWIAGNLPAEAIGGGFTRRCVIAFAEGRKKDIPLPPPPDKTLYRMLVQDLQQINSIVGCYNWTPEALKVYEEWYISLSEKIKVITDERVQPFLSEVHSIAIKVSIILHAAKNDEKIIDLEDITMSIALLDKVINEAHLAFSSHGRSASAIDVDRIMQQLRVVGTTTEAELLRMNYRNTNRVELTSVLDTLEGMKVIRRVINAKGQTQISWIGAKEC